MLIYLNKIRKKWLEALKNSAKSPSKSKRLLSSSGQVAVVLILVIAIGLIFYAVTLNLGKIAQTKTQITISSNIGAALLGSQMASYGQRLFMETLQGQMRQCKFTLFFVAILSVILVVVGFVTGTLPATVGVVAGITVLAVGMAAIDIALIQPGIDKLFQKNVDILLDMRDGFLERALRTAAQNAVSDTVQVADEFDSDLDRIWGYDVGGEPRDIVSRFGVYFNSRLLAAAPVSTVDVQAFYDALAEFMYEGGDGWGLYDPVGCANNCCYNPVFPMSMPSVCNPCCQPDTILDLVTGTQVPNIDKPACCDAPAPLTCGITAACVPNAPFLAPQTDVYDPYFEDHTNAFESFKELLGVDDEHQNYYRDINPLVSNIINNPTIYAQTPGIPPPEAASGFYVTDTTGYYDGSVGTVPLDYRTGVFDFFYKIAEWGMDLSTLDVAPFNNFYAHCYWYDQACATPLPYHLENIKTNAGFFPLTNLPASLTYNTTNFVDGANLVCPGTTCNPVAVDAITLPGNILAADNICAQDTIYPTNNRSEGFWKRGGDRFCSSTWPYASQCGKHNFGSCQEDDGTGTMYDVDCDCDDGPSNPVEWPDDVLDDIVYGLPEFFAFAEREILNKSVGYLATNLVHWYPSAADWIEPSSSTAAALGIPCFVCDAQDGFLWIWYFEMVEIRDRLIAWRDTVFTPPGCFDVWCTTPTDGSCAQVQVDEMIEMNAGTMQDVANCLTFNATGVSVTGTINYPGGNPVRFQNCDTACTLAETVSPTYPAGDPAGYVQAETDCGCAPDRYLPRSLVADFDPNADFTCPDMINLMPLLNCPLDCQNCFAACGAPFATCTATCNASEAQCITNANNTEATCIAGCSQNPVCIAACQAQGAANRLVCNNVRATCIANCTAPNQACVDACICLGIYDCDGPTFLTDVTNDAIPFKGSCIDTAPGGYIDLLRQSIPEAENQVDKFQMRANFLQDRIDEMNNIIQVLDDAIVEFYGFLTGPAVDLINARIAANDGRLPNQVVYGWQSSPPVGAPPTQRGLWHIVRVDARIPTRCNERCDPNQTGPQEFPRVDPYKRAWGTQRCYELVDTRGTVKVRVTRYDENRASNPLYFPNGQPIWDFRNHMDRSSSNSPANIELSCPPIPHLNNIYDGAFLINEAAENPACWNNYVEPLLTNYGVATETCAQYFMHTGARSGFNFKFVPCFNFN